MPRYVAFLRAINVGGHTVKMDRLRKLFEQLSLRNVETFIASGNVIFQATGAKAPALEKQIASHLEQALGFEVTTFLRTGTELATIASRDPFDVGQHGVGEHVLHVGFLGKTPAAAAVRKVEQFRTPTDELTVHGRELYWLRRGGLSMSAITGSLLERTLGMQLTLRNANTVRRLASRYGE